MDKKMSAGWRRVFLFLIILMMFCCLTVHAQTDDLEGAKKLLDENRYSEAIVLLQKIPDSRHNLAVRRVFVQAYIHLDDLENGVKTIKAICADDIESYSDLSWGEFLRKHKKTQLDLQLAGQLFDHSLAKSRMIPKEFLPFVTALEKAKRYDELKNVFEALLKKNPVFGADYAAFVADTLHDRIGAEDILKKSVWSAQRMPGLSAYDYQKTYENLVTYYSKRGMKDKLFRCLKEMEKQLSHKPSALLYIAGRYSAYARYKEAQAIYKGLLGQEDGIGSFYTKKTVIQYAHMLVKTGKRDKAIKMLDSRAVAVAVKDTKTGLQYQIAALDIIVNYSRSSNIPEITKRFDAALSLDPKGTEALTLLEYIREIGREHADEQYFVDLGSRIYTRCGYMGYDIFARYLSGIDRGGKALTVIREGIAKFENPSFKRVLLNAGLFIAGENRLYDDFFIFEKDLLQYRDYDSLVHLGRIYETYYNEYKTASKNFQKAKDLAGNDKETAECVLSMARCKYKAGQFADAETIIKSYSKKSRYDQRYLYVSRFYSFYAKDRDKAINVLNKAVVEAGDINMRVNILKGMGDAFLAGDDPQPDKAIASYEKALKLSDDTKAYAMVALTYNNYTKDFEKTQQNVNIILDREPENPLYLSWQATNLARYYNTRNEALSIAYRVPADKRSKYSLACIYARLGDKDRALDFLERDFKEVHSRKGRFERNEQRYWMLADNDLSLLRGHPRFTRLTDVEK